MSLSSSSSSLGFLAWRNCLPMPFMTWRATISELHFATAAATRTYKQQNSREERNITHYIKHKTYTGKTR